ncbi:MAG: response regulator [Candidatus Zixiibacteriota bacterium]|nr:MAG: response regulator [candidate division Zixibacteria bacterium]
MNLEKSKLKDLERRDWHLWTFMIGIFLVLLWFVVALVFYSDVYELYRRDLGDYTLTILLVGFLGLCLLSLSYVVIKEKSIKSLRIRLVEEQALSKALEVQLQEWKALFRVSSLVNSKVELPSILDTICENVMSCLGADQSSLMFHSPRDRKLRCIAAFGTDSDVVRGKEVDEGKSVAGWVVKHNKPLLLEDNLSDYDFAGFVQKDRNIRCSLCVPLKVNEVVKGVLNVNLLRQKRRFTETDLQLLCIFAENAAVAIEKASLYEELKDKVTQLIDSQRLGAVGEITSGVAHDLNNLLSVVIGRAQLLSGRMKDDGQHRHVEAMEKAATDASEIVHRLRQFGRPSSNEGFANVEVAGLVDEVVEMTRPRWNEWAKLRGINVEVTKLVAPVPPVHGCPSELRQVLVNLILNSIDALPGGGEIILQATKEGAFVLISVTDNGAGITEEVKTKVFEPFFTTKPDRGTGLGLSVARRIILNHDGEIGVESQAGEGTTFTIKLPVSRTSGRDVNRAAAPDSPAGLSILVVDDEQEVGSVLNELLSDEGHQVRVADDGSKAISLLEKHAFDVVITDLGMRGLTGWDVASAAKKTNPKLPVIMLTGWVDSVLGSEAERRTVDMVLSKPTKRDELMKAITQVVSQKAVAPEKGSVERGAVITPSGSDKGE